LIGYGLRQLLVRARLSDSSLEPPPDRIHAPHCACRRRQADDLPGHALPVIQIKKPRFELTP
jgi:hypothetical protein